MKPVITLLILSICLPAAAQDKAIPAGLRDYLPKLAKSVQLIGVNQVEDAFLNLDTETNPAFRGQARLDKFREQWMKLFVPIGRLKFDFESFDVIAYHRVSTQSYFIHGTANGTQGPVVFDFRVFRYQGRWHIHGFTFSLNGWKRDQPIHDKAFYLESPASYEFAPRQVAVVTDEKK